MKPSETLTLAYMVNHPATRDIVEPYAVKYNVSFDNVRATPQDLMSNNGGGFAPDDLHTLIRDIDTLSLPLQPEISEAEMEEIIHRKQDNQ